MKTCSKCNEVLDLEHFARDASKGSGRKSLCKPCDREKSRAYYGRNREAVIRRVRRYQATERAA